MSFGEFIKKLTTNVLSLFVVGERLDLEAQRGITIKHTAGEEKRFDFAKKLITRSNVWLLRLSGGRLGNSFLGRPVLLMTTIGRQSGKPRTQPLFYVEDGSRILLVASNGGSPEDPLWARNVRVNPQVRISRKGVERIMRAHIADADEKAILWPKMTAAFPYWQEISDRSQRDFPVVVLQPAEPAGTTQAAAGTLR